MKLTAPYTENNIRSLHVGDQVDIYGPLYTARDAVHKYLHEGGKIPISLKNQIIYHCGPVMVKENGKWLTKAAGPTTSIREEPYQAEIIEKFGIRAVIGKGGMGQKTLEACQKFGCVYLHAVGGAAQVLAHTVKKVNGVYLLEKFGAPEAIWEFEVEHFSAIVTMDSFGKSLHDGILAESKKKLEEIFASLNGD
jgi:tartrate/fumarate subfamily iron-sulfur-dependent hydro-lyase beta chain